MLTTQTLRQELLELGFTPLEDIHYSSSSPLQVRLLDGPRLRLDCPQGGLRYVAVLSSQHLAQEVAAFQTPPRLPTDR